MLSGERCQYCVDNNNNNNFDFYRPFQETQGHFTSEQMVFELLFLKANRTSYMLFGVSLSYSVLFRSLCMERVCKGYNPKPETLQLDSFVYICNIMTLLCNNCAQNALRVP